MTSCDRLKQTEDTDYLKFKSVYGRKHWWDKTLGN